MRPNCPKCHRPMSGGAPHGPWPVQWECVPCGVYLIGAALMLINPVWAVAILFAAAARSHLNRLARSCGGKPGEQ